MQLLFWRLITSIFGGRARDIRVLLVLWRNFLIGYFRIQTKTSQAYYPEINLNYVFATVISSRSCYRF